MITLPSSYFGPILQYAIIAQNKEYAIENHEHFVKQSFRSRCEIYGANGKLSLIVPLQKWKNHDPINTIFISKEEEWQKLHWKSIQSAYQTSPYFEFYEEEVKPLFFLAEESLVAHNKHIEEEVKDLIGIQSQSHETESYTQSGVDLRKLIHPKNKEITSVVAFTNYIQVFEEKHGFIENLSILDLLFNLGPNTKTYLENLSIPWHKK